MEIEKKLMEIQTQIKAPKNLWNKFGKYYYRNAESICQALKPHLEATDTSLVMRDDIKVIGDRLFLKATVTLNDNATDGSITTYAYAELDANHAGMSAEQKTGSCSSYARKYALNAMFLLDDTKDPDSDEYKEENEAKAQAQKPVKCVRCKKELKSVKKTDGTIMTADEVKDLSLKRYKDIYCDKCMVQLEEAIKKVKDKSNAGQ